MHSKKDNRVSGSDGLSTVMPAHSRPKDGVATLAYVADIHALAPK
jgi:hypothetical protein